MKLPKIIYSKLGKLKLWGQAHFDKFTIELDYRLKGKKHLEILLHEASHLRYPQFTEEEITEMAIYYTNILWKESYRRTDNTNEIPLQNGTT